MPQRQRGDVPTAIQNLYRRYHKNIDTNWLLYPSVGDNITLLCYSLCSSSLSLLRLDVTKWQEFFSSTKMMKIRLANPARCPLANLICHLSVKVHDIISQNIQRMFYK